MSCGICETLWPDKEARHLHTRVESFWQVLLFQVVMQRYDTHFQGVFVLLKCEEKTRGISCNFVHIYLFIQLSFTSVAECHPNVCPCQLWWPHSSFRIKFKCQHHLVRPQPIWNLAGNPGFPSKISLSRLFRGHPGCLAFCNANKTSVSPKDWGKTANCCLAFHISLHEEKYLTILNSNVLFNIIRNAICCSTKYLGNNNWQIKPSKTFFCTLFDVIPSDLNCGINLYVVNVMSQFSIL